MSTQPLDAIQLKNITKTFGEVRANDGISLTVKNGEILALLGENGSGKSTLMNILSGIYFPDGGEILVRGRPATIRSPRDAYALGIGMVHQHFKLTDVMTAAENIALGTHESSRVDLKSLSEQIRSLAQRYGFSIDPEKKVYTMSVSEKQTVEILKVLCRGADILILDEPTAVLTPQETEYLFQVLRRMRADGKAIILITHKLSEVLSLSDRIVVLRKGQLVDTVATEDATEQSLTEMMVGKKISLDIVRAPAPDASTPRLTVERLCCTRRDGSKALDNISFTLKAGEILGVAGISNSGQEDLLEAIAGLQPVDGGEITYFAPETGVKESLVGKSPLDIHELGIALSFVPEDRLGMGLVGDMGLPGNMLIRSYREGRSIFTRRRQPRDLSRELVKRFDVATPNIDTPVRQLSGGNVQKVLVGRELACAPNVLLTAYAVRGLDINTAHTIYRLLNEQKMQGCSILYVGEDLDVLLALCDRILVLCDGRVTGIVDARTATKTELGRLMASDRKEGKAHD